MDLLFNFMVIVGVLAYLYISIKKNKDDRSNNQKRVYPIKSEEYQDDIDDSYEKGYREEEGRMDAKNDRRKEIEERKRREREEREKREQAQTILDNVFRWR